MVSGIYKRGHPTQASSTSATPSLLSSATATGSLSLGWKFPLRGDSLPFSRSNKHHIIHADTKNGIDQLANYLRSESELSSGKLVRERDAGANTTAPATHQSLVSDSNRGLRSMAPVGKRLMGVSNRSWHSLAQLGGDRKTKHKYTTSISGTKEKTTGFLVFQDTENDPASGYIASPPLSRQNSSEREYRDPRLAKQFGSDDSVMLSAQTPPSNLADSPTFVDGFGSMDVSKAGDDFSDASMIIDMYADNQAQSKNNSLVSLHDSGYGSSGDSSIGKKDGFRVSEDLGDVEGVASDNHYKDAVKPLLSIYADSDIDAINAMLHSLPNTPSAEHFDKDGEHGSENDSEQRGGSALGQSQMLLARSRMSMQQELRQKLVRCLQDDYVNCIQDQEIKSSKLLSEAEERYKALLATKEKEFEQKLAEQEQKHKGDMERQSNEAKAQLEKLQTKVDELTAERDGLHNMLEDFVLTSTKLLDHREAENRNLSQELGRLTFENQQLQKKMEKSRAHAQAMSKEHGEVQERVDVLVAENMRLETINSTLTGDVAIAEERNQKIKEHAEKTLQRANLEIEQLQQKASCLQQESAALRNRSSKADMRIKSLQIQLQSTQRQNDELLGLCERLEASTGVS